MEDISESFILLSARIATCVLSDALKKPVLPKSKASCLVIAALNVSSCSTTAFPPSGILPAFFLLTSLPAITTNLPPINLRNAAMVASLPCIVLFLIKALSACSMVVPFILATKLFVIISATCREDPFTPPPITIEAISALVTLLLKRISTCGFSCSVKKPALARSIAWLLVKLRLKLSINLMVGFGPFLPALIHACNLSIS